MGKKKSERGRKEYKVTYVPLQQEKKRNKKREEIKQKTTKIIETNFFFTNDKEEEKYRERETKIEKVGDRHDRIFFSSFVFC